MCDVKLPLLRPGLRLSKVPGSVRFDVHKHDSATNIQGSLVAEIRRDYRLCAVGCNLWSVDYGQSTTHGHKGIQAAFDSI